MSDFEYYSRIFTYDPESGELRWNALRKGTTIGSAAGSACKDKHGNVRYLRVWVDDRQYRAHRIAWLLHYGEWPAHEIDHIDGNPLNNKLSNLRDVSHAENKKNIRLHKNNASGIHGVWWSKYTNAWKPYINAGGSRTYLGSFRDFFEACCIRKSAELQRGFHENHGRVGA